jgi:hypothetical protein
MSHGSDLHLDLLCCLLIYQQPLIKIGTFYYDKPILILVLDSPDNSCPRGWSLISGEYPDFLMVDQLLFFFFSLRHFSTLDADDYSVAP